MWDSSKGVCTFPDRLWKNLNTWEVENWLKLKKKTFQGKLELQVVNKYVIGGSVQENVSGEGKEKKWVKNVLSNLLKELTWLSMEAHAYKSSTLWGWGSSRPVYATQWVQRHSGLQGEIQTQKQKKPNWSKPQILRKRKQQPGKSQTNWKSCHTMDRGTVYMGIIKMKAHSNQDTQTQAK